MNFSRILQTSRQTERRTDRKRDGQTNKLKNLSRSKKQTRYRNFQVFRLAPQYTCLWVFHVIHETDPQGTMHTFVVLFQKAIIKQIHGHQTSYSITVKNVDRFIHPFYIHPISHPCIHPFIDMMPSLSSFLVSRSSFFSFFFLSSLLSFFLPSTHPSFHPSFFFSSFLPTFIHLKLLKNNFHDM